MAIHQSGQLLKKIFSRYPQGSLPEQFSFPALYSDLSIDMSFHNHNRDLRHDTDFMIVVSPIDNQLLAITKKVMTNELDTQVSLAYQAYLQWRQFPAPLRGDLVRLFGIQLRENKSTLAELISVECGKILQESLGEVQEAIDICDYAVGLSRQLYGLTIVSERPEHRMMEQWHPLGVIGIITAFNFPIAVWAWNAAIALICGNTLLWKPSEKTPLCALACQEIFNQSVSLFNHAHRLEPEPKYRQLPQPLSSVALGDYHAGESISAHENIPLVSATGSVAMGKKVAQSVAARLGRSLLELGGNNAMIVSAQANMALAVRAIVFSAVGTCGQRCTSLRRLIVHESIVDELIEKLLAAYQHVVIGDPLDASTLMGPLIDLHAYKIMEEAVLTAKSQGGQLLTGGELLCANTLGGVYVNPAIIAIDGGSFLLRQETFAPILYISTYQTLMQAIVMNNQVPQGLSSAIFSDDLREVELFLSFMGSDCGIANVNIGTSGAEIGGAFGGEKDTGGGRESGSDTWKNYMRRSTNTINYSNNLPLAQGILFD